MDQLKQAIADHDTIVAGGNYTNASPDKQGAYTDAYNAAKNIVNGSPNVITMQQMLQQQHNVSIMLKQV